MSSYQSFAQQKQEEDKKHDDMASQLNAVTGAQVRVDVLHQPAYIAREMQTNDPNRNALL